MKNILIIETEHGGHYLTVYIRYILKSFKKKKVKITLLTSASSKIKGIRALMSLKSENIKFEIKTIINFPIKNYSSFQLMVSQINLYFAIKKKFIKLNTKVKFDYIILTSLQKFEKALVLFGSPFGNINFTGIYLGAKFHLNNYNIFYKSRYNFLSKKFFQLLIKIPNLKNIITNDALFDHYIHSTSWKEHKKLIFLNDPMEFKFNFSKKISRQKLGLSSKSILILVYGALSSSKGIKELLSIFNNILLSSDIKVIFAGLQDENIKNFFNKNTFVKKLKLQKKVLFYNKWVSEKKEALFFGASDIVWIGYKNYPFPSGVLNQAIIKQIPVLISDDGYIYKLNRKYKFGRSVNIYKPSSIIKGINFIMNKKNKKN